MTAEIVNARTGQRMRFVATGTDTGGRLLRIECWSPPSSAREPEHVHPSQESRFEMFAGTLAFEVDGVEQWCGPGERFTIPAGAVHRFWNPGTLEAHFIQEFAPALEIERFFRTLFALGNEGRLDERGMPSPLAIPALASFGDEVRPTSPPWPVLRLAAMILRPAAALQQIRSTWKRPA